MVGLSILIIFLAIILGLSYLVNKLAIRFIPEGKNKKAWSIASFLLIAVVLGVSVFLLIIYNLQFTR